MRVIAALASRRPEIQHPHRSTRTGSAEQLIKQIVFSRRPVSPDGAALVKIQPTRNFPSPLIATSGELQMHFLFAPPPPPKKKKRKRARPR